MWARLENDKVVEIIDFDPKGKFHPSLVFASCKATTKVGMTRSQTGAYSLEVPVKTEEEKIAEIITVIEKLLNNTASSYGYDNINTVVSYADEPSVLKFQQEGQAFRVWRSLVWEKANSILADWQAEIIPEPTVEEVITQLPILII